MSNSRSSRIFLSPPHMGGAELGFLQEVFKSNYVAPVGPMVDAFEEACARYLGIPHCLAVASGTAAMHLALRDLGVSPGDEVLAATLTFIGSVSSIVYLGATPVFIDADASTWTMDPELLSAELAACARRGKLPKAVIPTDLYGQCSDLARIQAACEPYGIPVVVDAAEAMGAFYQAPPPQCPLPSAERQRGANGASGRRACGASEDTGPAWLSSAGQQKELGSAGKWRHAGAGAKAAIYSFNGNKIITTSGGGLLASEDARLIAHARKLSQQAREPVPYYEHLELGYNYRMSNVLAAIGRGQLAVLDQRVAAKRKVFETYRQLLGGLPGIEFMPEASYGRSNRWLTVLLLEPSRFGATNEQVRLALEAENIEARPVWKPMHLQPVFRDCRMRGGGVSERLFRLGLCLPSGTAMTSLDIERVAHVLRQCGCERRQRKARPAHPNRLPRPQAIHSAEPVPQ